MLLTDLPHDILTTLNSYIHSIQDLSSVLLTCRALYAACCSPTPGQLKHLVEKQEHGLHPQPHLLIAVKARKLADWAVDKAHPERREILAQAVKLGPSQLLKLALEVEPLSLRDCLRANWAKRVVLDPLTKELDVECGQELRESWRRDAAADGSEYYKRYFLSKEPDYEPSHVEELDHLDSSHVEKLDHLNSSHYSMFSVCEDVGLAILNYCIYCDLFHHTILPPSIFSPSSVDNIEPLSDALRLDWLHYCVPDNNDKYVAPQGEYQQLDIRQLLPCLCHRLHRALMKNGRIFGDDQAKQNWFYSTATNLGMTSLRLIIPGQVDKLPEEINRVKDLMEDKIADEKYRGDYNEEYGMVEPTEIRGSDLGDDDDDMSWVSLDYDVRISFKWA